MTELLIRKAYNAGVMTLMLNRPQKKNALNGAMIAAMSEAIDQCTEDSKVRLVRIEGEGEHFCAGADIEEMRGAGAKDEAQNLADAMQLAQLLWKVHSCFKPVVVYVQGAALGGGCGLVCAADAAFADEESYFAFPEVRLGIGPAVIAPYVIAAIGARQARRYWLSGERIDARRAREIQLIHGTVAAENKQAFFADLTKHFLAGSAQAQGHIKRIIGEETGKGVDASAMERGARNIAALRRGSEAQARLAAFLARRN